MSSGKSKTAIITALAAGITLFASATAFADNNTHTINDTIPAFQQSHYLSAWSRSSSTANSQVKFTSTSAADLMNVKAENLQTNAEYTELKGIGPDGVFHNITNKTPAGDQSRLIITAYDNIPADQHANGSYIIH